MTQSVEAKTIWGKLDDHGRLISLLQSDLKLESYRVDKLEINDKESCKQIILTKSEVMNEMKENNKKLSELVADKHRQEGATAALRWFYFCIGLLVAIGQAWNIYSAITH